jgi:uncharacterized membrane protein YhhN
MSKNEEDTVQADTVEDLSPHNKALYEAGKNLLVESVSVGREFCKFMTTTTLGAIPIYLALLKLVLPQDYVLQSRDEVLFLLPPVLFLVSSIVFILGYFPQRGHLSLDLPSEIEQERRKTIVRRQRYAAFAFIVFVVGVLYGAWQIVQALGASR